METARTYGEALDKVLALIVQMEAIMDDECMIPEEKLASVELIRKDMADIVAGALRDHRPSDADDESGVVREDRPGWLGRIWPWRRKAPAEQRVPEDGFDEKTISRMTKGKKLFDALMEVDAEMDGMMRLPGLHIQSGGRHSEYQSTCLFSVDENLEVRVDKLIKQSLWDTGKPNDELRGCLYEIRFFIDHVEVMDCTEDQMEKLLGFAYDKINRELGKCREKKKSLLQDYLDRKESSVHQGR